MARLNMSGIKVDTLDELIPKYALNKVELDSYDKLCKEENEEIKKQLAELGKNEYTAGEYVAKRNVQYRETLNEDRLLEVLKKHKVPGVIKTKEYIDMDALESYLYHVTEPLDELIADMNSCKSVKEVITLRVTKVKKKKEDDEE